MFARMNQCTKKIMIFSRYILVFFLALTSVYSCKQDSSKKFIQTHYDSISYSLGMIYAQKLPENFHANHIDSISYEFFIQGIQDFFDSTHINQISDSEITNLTNSFIAQLQTKREQAFLDSFKINIEKGTSFLKENKNQNGVIELEKGLQYKTIYSGWGQQKPTISDTVLVFYQVYSIDNKLLYDSKSEFREPVSIILDSTILAWQKILPLYVTGGKVRIYASHEFAYGSSYSRDNHIEPYATLIFDIELYKFIRGNKEAQTTTSSEPEETLQNSITQNSI